MDHFSLSAGFPQASEAEWLALVDKALAKARFDTLRTKLHEGFATEPLYTQAQSRPPLFGSRGWYAVQPLTGSEAQLADALHGDSALSIDFDAGLDAETATALKYLLGSDVPYILAPGSLLADAALVLAANEKSGIEGSAGFDPLTAFAVSGERPRNRPRSSPITWTPLSISGSASRPSFRSSRAAAPGTAPAAPPLRSWPSRWPLASAIGARWRRRACRLPQVPAASAFR